MRHLLLLTMLAAVAGGNAHAQGRFLSNKYPSVKSTVVYCTPFNQSMDIYQPGGDTSLRRPLIILAHSGGFTGGTRISDPTVDSLCVRFARRGYVTASIDYRLGAAARMTSDSVYAMDVMVKAMSDGKAAIRYFIKDAATTNTYRIDTNYIFVGGNSAGSILYLHDTYVDNLADCPPYMQTAIQANGGLDGNSGNPGYAVKIKADIDLAGALVTTKFIQPGDKPCVASQGTLDLTVPYNSGYFMNKTVKLWLNGLGVMSPAFETAGVYHSDLLFPGAAHVPWNNNLPKLNSVDSLIKNFLYTLVCTDNGGMLCDAPMTCQYDAGIHSIIVNASAAVGDITVYNTTDIPVLTVTAGGLKNVVLSTAGYTPGTYRISARFNDPSIVSAVRQVKVE